MSMLAVTALVVGISLDIAYVPPSLARSASTSTCSANHWSAWINRDKPHSGPSDGGDREAMTPTEMSAFCHDGRISQIECVTDSGIQYYASGDIMSCTIEHGVVCLNADNYPIPCSDYKVRYFCDCEAAHTCHYGGHTYHDMDSFRSTDGCNTCGCNGGAVTCTQLACGDAHGRCHYGGHTYQAGETFNSVDGCNFCGCNSGTVSCTTRACA